MLFKYLFYIFIPLIFISCTNKEYAKKIPIEVKPKIQIEYIISDLKTISQNPSHYILNIKGLSKKNQLIYNKQFNKRYFKPWNLKNISRSKEESTWAFLYKDKTMYGQNYRVIKKRIFQRWIDNSNFQEYNTIKQNAITIRNSSLRVFPTSKPMFLDPKVAGEGFPFDYNQNSAIKINNPLFISHFSKDKAWVFVESNFTVGWISIKDIAFVDKKTIITFKNSNYFIATNDNFAIYKKGVFKDIIKLGTIFPKTTSNKYMVISRGETFNGYISTVYIKDKNIAKKPLSFTAKNITKITSKLLGEEYGWGGLHNTRDCSSMTRDFFSIFGIYLERNSSGQVLNGKYISFDKLTNNEKKKLIIDIGKPFLSLIYLKGHVMLYIGDKNNEPIVFHDMWGIRTIEKDGKPGRQIVGKSIISSLEPGKEITNRYDPKHSLINKAQGIILLG
ncbi:MAG: SH3 domain-containing protein, partial [Campylobacterota bacterium]|nr:SH3 domain-containing protein [Campylobacterota bacterium]